MKVIASNRKARHDYTILDTYEAGIVLMGTEIKSVRATKVNISDSYVLFRDEEAYIMNMHIGKYKEGNIFNHDETSNNFDTGFVGSVVNTILAITSPITNIPIFLFIITSSFYDVE